MEKGTTISHYQILEKLGEGGMGVVYKAHDTKLDRVVALKFLPSAATETEEETRRFVREAKTAAALNHPNICTIHQIEEHEGRRFIAMEYVEGQTLKEILSKGALPLKQAIQYARQIAEALGEAHEKGITHRDIKPENIMVDKKGRVKVMDFGLAKLAGAADLTQAGTTTGTVAYMSPEQIRGEEADYRSDIFSFGIILYEMLAGKHPFRGGHQAAMMYSIANEEPVPISKELTDSPYELSQLVDNMLRKNPDDRITDVLELNEIFESMQTSGTGIYASEKTTPSYWRQWSLYAALAFVLAITAATVFFWPETRANTIRSIAVLPLDDYSEEADQEYFANGMTEALITDLSKVGDWRVTSRTSSMRYKNSDKSLPEIAEELGVDALIEGSVLRVDNNVRITVQLIDARRDEHIWADNFDREMQDVLLLHSEVAQEIARQVNLELSDAEEEILFEKEPVDPETYELYLQGLNLAHSWYETDVLEGIELLEQALAKDSTYAPVHAAMALAYTHLSHYRYPHDVWPTAEQYASKALELDEEEATAHMAMGIHDAIYNREWKSSEYHFKRALELDPSSAEARSYYAWYLSAMSKKSESIHEIEKAKQIDPLAIPVREIALVLYILLREYDEAIQEALSVQSFAPEGYGAASLFMGTAYAMKGDSASAVEVLDPIMERTSHLRDNGESPVWLAWGTYAYAEVGATEKARIYLQQIIDITEEQHVCAYDVGAVYGRLGDFDNAFSWLDRSIRESSPCLPNSQIDPRLDVLRDDPRFAAFMEDAGF